MSTKNNDETKPINIFDKYMNLAMDKLGFTTGVGLIGVGGFWFLYGLFQFVTTTPNSAPQQAIVENFFNQAQNGVIIVALGVLIKAVKEKD